jgi:hypothetical protein
MSTGAYFTSADDLASVSSDRITTFCGVEFFVFSSRRDTDAKPTISLGGRWNRHFQEIRAEEQESSSHRGVELLVEPTVFVLPEPYPSAAATVIPSVVAAGSG